MFPQKLFLFTYPSKPTHVRLANQGFITHGTSPPIVARCCPVCKNHVRSSLPTAGFLELAHLSVPCTHISYRVPASRMTQCLPRLNQLPKPAGVEPGFDLAAAAILCARSIFRKTAIFLLFFVPSPKFVLPLLNQRTERFVRCHECQLFH